MKISKVFLFIAVLITANHSYAQNRIKCKYGDVKPEDFASAVYSIDSSAQAVYLFDGGNADFEGNNKGGLSIKYSKHTKMRLLNKNAFDAATIEIPLYISTFFEQRLENLDAVTYNIEDGKVVPTKLDKSSIFKDKQGEYQVLKFTFPNIKEGSIIEYRYTISTPSYRYLPEWVFQGKYPRLWSEYEVTIPQFYDYAVIRQGYQPYAIDTATVSQTSYNILDPGDGGADARPYTIAARANTVNSVWAMKDVPAMKPESYTTTLDNHVSKIEFQLSAIRYPEEPVKIVMRNWMDVASDLMKDEDYGEPLSHNNGFLNDDIKKAAAGETNAVAKAKKIFEFVRDNYTCTDYSARYLSQQLKKTVQARKGNVVDINMVLTAMLQSAGYEAHPVMLSTRDHGRAYEIYPVLSKFNYTISDLMIDGKQYLLDAANTSLGFNRLSDECYNGYARIIDVDKPYVIDLSADSLRESKITSVFIINNDKGEMEASFNSTLGYLESLDVREKLNKEKQEDFFKDIKKAYSMDVEILNPVIDSLNKKENPIAVKYDMKINTDGSDLLYFNPMLAEEQKENPFSSAERTYPVEMPACEAETYVLNMDVPAGYVVDELPKSTRVKLNEDEGMYEYIIAQSGNHIQLRSYLNIKKANFAPEDYQTLRDFFTYVVKKQSEQIVFKKVK